MEFWSTVSRDEVALALGLAPDSPEVTDMLEGSVVPGATADEVDACERALGVVLPALYRRLVMLQDGGHVVRPRIALPEPADDTHAQLSQGVWGVTSREGPSLLDSPALCSDTGLPAGLVLLSGDGHEYIALDYRHGGEPGVVWVSDSGEMQGIAASFEDFVDRLEPAESLEAQLAKHGLDLDDLEGGQIWVPGRDEES